ncbi:MAG TPA: hypothetical protein VGQ42_05755 [Candidatus Dormibacteraeota bacterium]|jgi:hypothetical protein|nr:hypothetical protein [Candidatus Dormibacteraeota bacterium]
MLRPRVLAAALAMSAGLVACGGDNPPNPYPATPTPASLAPQSMVLRPTQMTGYKRTEDVTVDPNTLADQANDQSLVGTLTKQGLQQGVRVTFSDPNAGAAPTPFVTVISEVLVFKDNGGATAFFGDEKGRRAQASQGGTVGPLDGLPTAGADAVAGLVATLPPQSADQAPSHALFALVRRGRVVAELLGSGTTSTATMDRFTALFTVQVEQISAALVSP